MLGVSQAATVGFNFQADWTEAVNGTPSPGSSPNYTGKPVTAAAFGIGTNGWENLTPMPTGYNFSKSLPGPFTNNEVIDTTTRTNGLNPLPNGSLNITWSAVAANTSGFRGYGPPYPSSPIPGYPSAANPNPGDQQVYYGFLRDDANIYTSPTSTEGYSVTITGLRSVWTNGAYAIELVSATDTGNVITNANITSSTGTQSVTYNTTNASFGIMGGLSTMSGPWTNDEVTISGAPGLSHTTGYAIASTIAGLIITDKPVITMPPNQVVACPGDTVVWSAYAVGVPPLAYQWRKNGLPLPGATTLSLGLTNVGPAQAGTYDLLVSNQYGIAISAPVSPDHIAATAGHNFIVDSNTNGPAIHGMESNATWLASSGTRTGVMSFNGTNSQIVVPGDTNFDAAAGAITFWMRSPGVPNTNLTAPAILFDRNGTNGGLLIGQKPTGEILVQTSSGNPAVVSGSTLSADNNWHFIAIVYELAAGGNLSIYVDGTVDTATANANAWSWTTGQELEFGLSDAVQYQPYNGLLDDVRIYNQALADADISALYTNGVPANNSALVSQFLFNTAPVAGASFSWFCSGAVLQSADAVSGPYTDMTYPVFTFNSLLPGSQKFYRYRVSHTPQTIVSNPYRM